MAIETERRKGIREQRGKQSVDSEVMKIAAANISRQRILQKDHHRDPISRCRNAIRSELHCVEGRKCGHCSCQKKMKVKWALAFGCPSA